MYHSFIEEEEDAMHQGKESICQYLKGSPDGAQCGVAGRLVRCMKDADIQLCMNRRHEACLYYISSLREVALKTVYPDAVSGAA
jgi:hypothetical protein